MIRSETTAKFVLPRMSKRAHKKRAKVVLRSRMNLLRQLISKNTQEFCRNTSLHGLVYMSKKELHPLEKMFFALAFLVVLLLSVYFILNVFDKWNTTPVLFGLNPEPTFITKEPFPAVTICNLNQADKKKAAQYSIYSTEYAMIQMLCQREVNVSVASTITDWNQLPEFIRNISQPCNEMLLSCKFGGVKYNCTHIFNSIITDEGLCCVFNIVHPSFLYTPGVIDLPVRGGEEDFVAVDWSAETGYPKNLPKKYYPRPAAGTGESLGLSLTLDVDSDSYYCSSMNSIGFKMLLHNPTGNPSLSELGLLLSAGSETRVRIRADNTESEQKLRSLRIEDRQCVFEDELHLDIFSRYTQDNCYIECTGGDLLRYCGCVPHYLPKWFGNETTCSIYDSTCVKDIRLRAKTEGSYCYEGCLPSCYDLTFMPDFFSTPLSHDGFQIVNQMVKNLSSEYVEKNIAIVHIYYKDNSFRSNKQTEFIGLTDFLSSVGGLIGLFFGFSFISCAEFFFYTFIRPFRAVRNAKHAKNTVLNFENSKNHKSKRLFGNAKYDSQRQLQQTSAEQSDGLLRSVSETIDTKYRRPFRNSWVD